MERCIRQRLMQWLDDNELLPKEQFGFRPRRSVQDCLTVCLEDWSLAVDQGKCVDVITFDFSSAFDRVPHTRLLAKLAHLGVEGYVLQWIAAFLGDRTSAVSVGDECGDSFNPTSGTPQGSCLGPVLFIIYVHDISSVVEAPCKFAQYADDLQFWQVHDGSGSGFTLRNDLSSKDHLHALARSASARLFMAARTIRSGNVHLWKRIYATYIRPVLESSSPVFNPSTVGLRKDLESVQRRFTLMLELRSKRCHRDDRDSYEDRCANYDIPPLFHRRAIADILYETVVSELNRELEGEKEALLAARTTICEHEATISEKDSALKDEKLARSAYAAHVEELEIRLKNTEKRLQEKKAEIERLAQKWEENEVEQLKERNHLHTVIEEKEAALKMEQESRIKSSLENKRLWRLLHNAEQDLEENAEMDCVEKRELVQNPTLITAENIEDILKQARGCSSESDAPKQV